MRLNNLSQGIDNRPLKQFSTIFILTPNKKRKLAIVVFSLALVAIIILFTLLTSLVSAQEVEYPVPLLPKTGDTGVDVSSILFSWKPFYVATNKYDFELSTNMDMSNPIKATIIGGITTYQYTGTLEYNTTYWWRVIASDPPGGYWSPVSSFTTKAAPASTDNTTGAKPPSDSFLSSIIAYLEDIGWPMVGLIGGAIVIVIIAVIVLLKPKAKPAAQRQWQGTQPPPRMQPPLICPTCGFPNSPERKFCNNCGSNLISRGPQSPWGAQQPINCPTCGLPNTKGTKFCSNCGTGLIDRGPQQTWGTQPTNVCPTCGSPIPPGQKFCSKCGAGSIGKGQQQSWQVYQTFTCPICGANINKGINPCPSCGTWLDWGS